MIDAFVYDIAAHETGKLETVRPRPTDSGRIPSLGLEMTEITLFVAFSVVQTIEHWDEIPTEGNRGRHLSRAG